MSILLSACPTSKHFPIDFYSVGFRQHVIRLVAAMYDISVVFYHCPQVNLLLLTL
jgi:hypothetical protein